MQLQQASVTRLLCSASMPQVCAEIGIEAFNGQSLAVWFKESKNDYSKP